MLIIEFSITPLDKGESVSPYIAESLKIIDESGLDYKINPMGTCLEGEWDEVFAVVRKCFKKMKEYSKRITGNIKFDYRQGTNKRMANKIKSLEKKLKKELKK